MEQDAKRLLFERLDDCLKVHADMLDAENIGSIYELQGLAELHYYLKVEHEFTPAEVEALLSFQDPLDVARWCWEDNTHAHSFPICELLKEINAYERFMRTDMEPTLEAFLEAAKRYVRGGYDVIVDGIIGPWFLEPWRNLVREHYEVHYIVLRASTLTGTKPPSRFMRSTPLSAGKGRKRNLPPPIRTSWTPTTPLSAISKPI